MRRSPHDSPSCPKKVAHSYAPICATLSCLTYGKLEVIVSAILAIALLMLVPAGLAAVAVVERFMWRSIKRINERVDALATRSTVVIGKASEGGSFEEV